jgi:hypothetical protein
MGKLASIAAVVSQAQNSHVQAKKCYGSKISRGKLIEVTLGLADLMREGGTIRCL